MLANGQVRFGGGPEEKGDTAPRLLPTQQKREWGFREAIEELPASEQSTASDKAATPAVVAETASECKRSRSEREQRQAFHAERSDTATSIVCSISPSLAVSKSNHTSSRHVERAFTCSQRRNALKSVPLRLGAI
jgi:hypothetical protein